MINIYIVWAIDYAIFSSLSQQLTLMFGFFSSLVACPKEMEGVNSRRPYAEERESVGL